MTCLTEEAARKESDYMLTRMAEHERCNKCPAVALSEMTRRAIAKFYNCPYHILFGVKEMKTNDAKISRGQGQYVNANPKIPSSHDLGFLIRDKSGELTQIAVKDVDSAMLHDILDRADEIVISRVDVK